MNYSLAMKINHWPQPLKQALPMLQQIEAAGFEAYFVGGCVRDTLLEQPIHDVDLATSAYPEEIKQIFQHTIDTGIEHGTVTVVWQQQNYEITTFRTELGYQDFRRPDQVTFVSSLQDDLKRRDFTINALAVRSTGEIIDLFSGIQDLQHHEIQAVGQANERFHEDALRMMRAVRFQSQLDFTIAPATLAGIQTNAALLKKIAVERIHTEFIKLMQGRARRRALQSMWQSQLYRFCPQLQLYDFRKLIEQTTDQPLVQEASIWSLLGYLWQLDHLEMKRLLKAWKTSNEVLKVAQTATQLLLHNPLNDWNLYQAHASAVAVATEVLQVVGQNKLATALQQRWTHLPLHQPADLQINGQIIMQACQQPAGPQIGSLLTLVQQKIIQRQLANDQQAIVHFLKIYLSRN